MCGDIAPQIRVDRNSAAEEREQLTQIKTNTSQHNN